MMKVACEPVVLLDEGLRNFHVFWCVQAIGHWTISCATNFLCTTYELNFLSTLNWIVESASASDSGLDGCDRDQDQDNKN